MYNAIEKRIKSLVTSRVISIKEPLNSQFNTVYMIKQIGVHQHDDKNLCKKTHAVNKYVHKLVTKMRQGPQDDSTQTSRLCTYNNNKYISHIHWKPGTDTKYEISERGKGV